ncbi:hypothetical protein L204_102595 [Cryptococcus depauperatus]|nr:ubiquitin fusion degradation protein 1 [Cryptococcus depauperatus CBS 7855]
MNHGYDTDEDYDHDTYAAPPPLPGPGGFLQHLMGGALGAGMGFGAIIPPSAYDAYFKAYSTAVMGGRERPEVMYGGKIIMPPSALAKLSALDIPSPWTFKLRNPKSPTTHVTHAGVLEFIADEGIVHLPAWMMKTLNLEEGDPIRLTGATLPKGKMVKIQAQSTDFLQVSDPKAVLESALRFYSTLSANDIIEITYNSLTFEFLIMEIVPPGPGISVIDTDLEVDFATPKGYVEPPRPEPAPIPTMADKLNIDLNETHPASSAGGSRPGTSLGGRSGGETPKEIFTGVGQSLSGRKVKGKGLAKPIEEVESSSKISRNIGPKIITPESLGDQDRKVPAALTLPPGKFFFGFTYVAYDSTKAPKKTTEAIASNQSFRGTGNTLKSGKKIDQHDSKQNQQDTDDEKEDCWAKLGSGQTLRKGGTVETRQATNKEIIDATMLGENDFVFDSDEDMENGHWADDDIIEIDSD